MKTILTIILLLSTISATANQYSFPVICDVFNGYKKTKITDEQDSWCDRFRIVAFTISPEGRVVRNELNSKCYSTSEEAHNDLEIFQDLGVCKRY